MDKVKAQATVLADKAQTGVQQGQTKLQEMQTGKQVDHLLRELGAYVFLSERGRAQPDGEARVATIMGQLDALEAAGTAVTVTNDPSVVPAAGAVPQPHVEPEPGAAPPPPPPDTPSPTGSTIPKSGGGLPGQ
ncbi:MAG: hypothetical protein ABSC41_05205 [Acidimicrobiales bacterium]